MEKAIVPGGRGGEEAAGIGGEGRVKVGEIGGGLEGVGVWRRE